MPRSLFRLAAEFFNAVVHECQCDRSRYAPFAAFEIDNRDVEIASLHNLTSQKKEPGIAEVRRGQIATLDRVESRIREL